MEQQSIAQPPIELAGVLIMAGGLSMRMGSPKALLTLPSGETLLDYHVRAANDLNVRIFIADNHQGFEVKPTDGLVQSISDYQPLLPAKIQHEPTDQSSKKKHSAGPLGALLSALHQAQSHQKAMSSEPKWLLVMGCDSLVSAVDVWQLISSHHSPQLDARGVSDTSRNNKVICLSDNQRLYPLLGLYQLNLAESLKQYLDAGERRVMRFIDAICQPIAMPQDWHALSNLNTPAQFELACQQVSRKEQRK